MREVMTSKQVDMLQKAAADLQRANLSVEGTRVAGGSDTAQKAALLASGGMGLTLMGVLKAHGLTGLLTLIGLKGGAVGAFIGNKAGAAIGGLKAAGIKQTGDLVKEAMLNPELARVLLAKLTPQNQGSVTSAMVGQLGRIAAARGAHTAVAIQRLGQQQGPASPQNALSSLGSMGGIPAPLRNVLSMAGVGR